MGLGIARTTSTHMHVSSPVFPAHCPITFGLIISHYGVWKVQLLVGSLSPPSLLSAPQHHLKPSLASSIIPLAPKQPPEQLGTLQGEALHPFPHKPFLSSSRFLLHLNLDTFCSSAAEEGSGQHPPSPSPHSWVLEPAPSALQEPTFSFLSPCFLGFKVFLPH